MGEVMEFLKSSKRRTLVSELVYIILNIALAAAILAVIVVTESALAAMGLVLVSKWRVFAVRPRYWMANIKANLVDTIVGFSVVILIAAASGTLVAQCILAVLYIGWLLYVKPRSKRVFVVAQAFIAVFIGTTALMTISYDWFSSVVVLFMWMIGYASARHILSTYEEAHSSFYSLIVGLVYAELGWLAYHWTYVFPMPVLGIQGIPLVSFIAICISFMTERLYASYRRHDGIRSSDVILPVLLSVSIIFGLLFYMLYRMSVSSNGLL
jgi:hypothetical protein